MSDVQFCAVDGCNEVAVGHGYWQGRRGTENPRPPRPRDKCRSHAYGEFGHEFVRVQVVGPARIVDVRTGESVEAPGFVELDPVQTNIAMLVYGGLVKVADSTKAEPKAKG
jgi:hypothetical protein